jgi:hypothetical protein
VGFPDLFSSFEAEPFLIAGINKPPAFSKVSGGIHLVQQYYFVYMKSKQSLE